MKKIVIVNNGFSFGGIEMVSISLANYCANNGYDVSIIALYPSKHQVPVDPRIEIVEPNFQRGNKFIYEIKDAIFLRKNVKRIKPDVVVAHGEWTNGFAAFSLWGLGIPIYLQDHMNPNYIGKMDLSHTILNGFFYKRVAGVIALSEYAKQQMEKLYHAKNVLVLPNPVRKIEIKQGVEENAVVCIGRLSKEKGHRYLIEAWKQCNHSGWKLHIVGDGVEMNNLLQLAGTDETIIFHGFQKDIDKYLSVAKIFVLPSLSECFPLALIEAMSTGRACISTDCHAEKGIIAKNNINGLVVDPGNSEQLATAIERLIGDEELRKQFAIEAIKIKDELNEEAIYKKYLFYIKDSCTEKFHHMK